jgi:hypothetical protein
MSGKKAILEKKLPLLDFWIIEQLVYKFLKGKLIKIQY